MILSSVPTLFVDFSLNHLTSHAFAHPSRLSNFPVDGPWNIKITIELFGR